MYNRTFMAALCAVALSTAACGTQESAPAAEICEPDVFQCSGDTLERCNPAGTAFAFYRICDQGCAAGICKGGGGEATEGEGEADGGAGAGDDAGGEQVAPEGGDDGDAGAGVGDEAPDVICDADAQICNGDVIERCNPAGTGYAFYRECETGCADGACVPAPGEVAEGGGEGDEDPVEGEVGEEGDEDEQGDAGEADGGDGGGEGEGELPPEDLCVANAVECRGNQTCQPASGRCVEADACLNDGDCLGDRICVGDACQERCGDDNDCPGNRQCDVGSGRCPEAAFCINAADCDPGRSCVAGRCSDDCAADEECPGLQTCDVGRRQCREPAVCEGDRDCIGPRLCDGGQCHDACRADGDCRGSATCDLDDGHCIEGLVCRNDGDCLGRRACENAACFDAQCAESQECAPQACVDRRCDDRPAPACAAGADCDGSQVCSPGGACVLDGRCEADDECPAGAPVCAQGWCAGCGTDDDCAGAEVCRLGWCELVRGCVADPDCPGDRQCDDGQCTPIQCDGDRFDGQDGGDRRLVGRVYTGLVLCDGEPEVYQVTARAGEGLRVTLRHEPGPAGVSLRIHPQGSPQLTLAWSDRRHGVEELALDSAPGARALELVVQGRPGWSPEYSLDIERLGANDCPRDSFEGLLGNEDGAHAAPVGAGDHAHVICEGDEDWFAVRAGAGTVLRTRISPGPDARGQAMEIQSADGELLAQGAPAGGALVAQVTAQETGPHMIRVRSTRPAERFSSLLSVDALAAPEAPVLACASGQRLVPGRVHQLRPHIGADRFRQRCAGAPAGGLVADHVVWFEMHEEDVIRLRLLGGQDRSILAIRTECPEADSELQCEVGAAAEIAGLQLRPGVHYVIVRSPAGVAPPALLLDIGARCEIDRDCPGGFHCDGGRCRVPCDDGANPCEDGLSCDVGTGHCVEVDPCESDASCAGVRACEPHVQASCFNPDCEDNSECDDGGSCVDRSCAPAPPGGCDVDNPCAGDLLCDADGACVQDGACANNGDCPPGAPVCHVDSGSCVLCLGDVGCSAAEVCRPVSDDDPVPTYCQYDGFCAGDEECPGTRFCQNPDFPEDHGNPDVCFAAPCDGDRFDVDLGVTPLRWRSYSGLIRCDGQDDTYVVRVPAGASGRVTVRNAPEDGDLVVRVQEAANPGIDISVSQGSVGVEIAEVPPAGAEREINVVVGGRAGFSVPYSITLER